MHIPRWQQLRERSLDDLKLHTDEGVREIIAEYEKKLEAAKQELARREAKGGAEEMWECTVCGKKSKDREGLINHTIKEHNYPDGEDSDPEAIYY